MKSRETTERNSDQPMRPTYARNSVYRDARVTKRGAAAAAAETTFPGQSPLAPRTYEAIASSRETGGGRVEGVQR